MASQRYEEQDKQNGIVDERKVDCVLKETGRSVLECKQDSDRVETIEIDEMLLMASQQYEEAINGQKVIQALKGECGKGDKIGILKTSAHGCVQDGKRSRYGRPKSTIEIKAVRKESVPVKTQEQNAWAGAIWRDWARY